MIRHWVDPDTPLPPADQDVPGHPGLIALGADLGPHRLVEAYSHGLFPWYTSGQPVLWWSPDPRMVVFTGEFSPARTLRRLLRQLHGRAPGAPAWHITLDTAFTRVMQACAEPRPGQEGTWITPAIIAAYTALHALGLAHSLEVWEAAPTGTAPAAFDDDAPRPQLIAGLYGVSLGRMFFGESMFTRRPNASKCAFATLMHLLVQHGFPMVDCQQSTRHLGSLGGRDISRAEFLARIQPLLRQPGPDWHAVARDLHWPDPSSGSVTATATQHPPHPRPETFRETGNGQETGPGPSAGQTDDATPVSASPSHRA